MAAFLQVPERRRFYSKRAPNGTPSACTLSCCGNLAVMGSSAEPERHSCGFADGGRKSCASIGPLEKSGW